MRRQLVTLALVMGLAGVLTLSCSSGSTSQQSRNPSSTLGSVALFGGDDPACDVVSFEVTITEVKLVPQGGGSPVSVTPPAKPIDFAALMDFNTVLSLSTVSPGTYSQVILT